MEISDIIRITSSTQKYNLHSHTQFCDGHADMADMAEAALKSGMLHWGFSPHSPICIDSPCNMRAEDIRPYLDESIRLREIYADRMNIYSALEIDFLSKDFGPHIDYFQNIPLHYRIGSVHFVPNQDGIPLDCDGGYDRFALYLKDGYAGDLRYVVEKYFEQVLTMLELGGFEILGHFDKIAGNSSQASPEIENQSWYEALVDDVISHAKSSGVVLEINTKSIIDKGRFFPAQKWWSRIIESEAPVVINSDAHWPEKVNLGREEAFATLSGIKLAKPE